MKMGMSRRAWALKLPPKKIIYVVLQGDQNMTDQEWVFLMSRMTQVIRNIPQRGPELNGST